MRDEAGEEHCICSGRRKIEGFRRISKSANWSFC